MRAALAGLEDIDWGTLHPNNAPGTEIPGLLRAWRDGIGFGAVPSRASTPHRLTDMLLHQGTRFGGAAEALPFLIELAAADETPQRPQLIYFAAGIGAPVEEHLQQSTFDRDLYARLSDEELWDQDVDVIDPFAAMCAQDSRGAWLAYLERVSELVDDADAEVRIAAVVVLAPERIIGNSHEPRLRRALASESDLGWHAALALGYRAEQATLELATTERLAEELSSPVLVRRASAAFALTLAGRTIDGLVDVLAETEQRYAELSLADCRFQQALTGMLARARLRFAERH